MVGESTVQYHINGQRHIGRLRLQGNSVHPDQVIVIDTQGSYECEVCEGTFWAKKNAHIRSERHRKKERFLAIRATLDEAEKDKHGVEVLPAGRNAFDFGILDRNKAGNIPIAISLTDPQLSIILVSAGVSSSNGANTRGRQTR